MDINEFQNLSREDQMAEAGRIAGVEPVVFDGMWRTESGRGANMLSPAGAEGHFGLMPNTRKVWEQRFGSGIDPYNFGQSLYTAAHQLKENLGRFPKLPDALRAYNGGWNPKAWANPETAAYASKVLGSDDAEADAETDASTAAALAAGPVVTRALTPAHQLWDRAASGPAARSGPPADLSAVASAVTAAMADMKPAPLPGPDYSAFQGITAAHATAELKRQAEIDGTGFLDAARAAANKELFNQTARFIMREDYPADPNFVVPEDALKGKTMQEQQDLRAARSKPEFDRILFDQQDAKEQDDIVYRKGTLFGIGADLVANLPAGALLGVGVEGVAGKAGVGALDAARAGNKGQALVRSFAEGAVGNVAYTAMLDAMGQHQGAEQYAMAVAGGLLNPLLTGRAIGSAAERAAQEAHALRIASTAREQQRLLAEQAVKNLGANASGEDIAKEMARLEAEGQRANIQSRTAAVPETRKFNVGEEQDLQAAGPATSSEMVQGKLKPQESVIDGHTRAGDEFTSVQQVRDSLNDEHIVAAKWETNEYQQARMDAMASDPTWRAAQEKITNGLTWEQVKELKTGTHFTAEMQAAIDGRRLEFYDREGLARNMKAVQDIVNEYLPGSRVIIGAGSSAGTRGEVMSVGRTHMIGLDLKADAQEQLHTVLHELGHAIYHQHAPKASPRVLAMIDNDWLDFVNAARQGNVKAWGQRFAITSEAHPLKTGRAQPGFKPNYAVSRDEYLAEQFVTHVQNRIMRGDYGAMSEETKTGIMNALRKVVDFVKTVIKNGLLPQGRGSEEFFGEVLRQGRMRGAKEAQRLEARGMEVPKATVADMKPTVADAVEESARGAEVINDPIALKYGLDLLPMGTPAEKAEAKQILALYKRADAWAAANPVDEKRMNKILSRFDSFDPISNQMLRSENPVVRMVASELLENGGGAAGRRSSAAIAKFMNERAIIGDVINELDGSFNLWLKGQGTDRIREFMNGRGRAQFNKLVAEEIEQRRYAQGQIDLGDHVRAAADAVERSFERARLMQIDAKTVGWAALPESSRGYMPHKMRSDVVRSLTPQQARAVHSALMDQFVEIGKFDMSFADQLASKYLDRVRQRALGGFDAPVGMHSPGAGDIVKEALEQMNLTRPEIDAAMKRYSNGAANHLKKRLNLDLRQKFTNEDGTTFRLLDLFDTDMLSLVRGQSQRVSGEVALARHGIMGRAGMRILRRSMGFGGAGHNAKPNELEAFDAAAAEFLGQPFGTQNKWVDRAMQANSVASLGGMGFNQMGEIINAATTLGVREALSAVSSFGRLRAEIKAKVAGKAVDNPLLDSIEKMGGAEFGTEAYKMVFPLDIPDAPIHTMGADTLHVADKLLRGAGHLQSKLSFWRAIHSTQVRGVAEQIVRKFAAALHEGKTDVTLADMGLTPEVLGKLRADAPNILQTQGGKLTGFDITKATDKEAAMALVQAVHRGAAQIIQGTFIGESGKYVHNSYLRMLAQFRNFSLTAVDKQWNRSKANYGIAKATGILMGSMAAAAPIYMLRTYLASMGRKDQEAYLDRMLTPGAIARATTNYVAASGFAGDFLDAVTSVTGTGAVTGGRSGTNTQLVGNLAAPVLGKVDKVWGALQDTKDGTDVHGLIKEAPLSRLPWLIPAINALGN